MKNLLLILLCVPFIIFGQDNIILNKMDGTAKGGIALTILHKLSIPISFIGLGESYDDLVEFDVNAYLESLIKI